MWQVDQQFGESVVVVVTVLFHGKRTQKIQFAGIEVYIYIWIPYGKIVDLERTVSLTLFTTATWSTTTTKCRVVSLSFWVVLRERIGSTFRVVKILTRETYMNQWNEAFENFNGT
jgi:hypothetical protein